MCPIQKKKNEYEKTIKFFFKKFWVMITLKLEQGPNGI